MRIQVRWNQNGPQVGDLTLRALPGANGKEKPFVLRNDGTELTPDDLKGITLEFPRGKEMDPPGLIQAAKAIGYDLRPK